MLGGAHRSHRTEATAGSRTILRLLVRPRSAAQHPERATEAALALLEAQGGGGGETVEAGGCRSVLLLPLMAAQLAFVMNQLLLTLFLVNPILRRAWRARSALADATAVELTRYPTAWPRAWSPSPDAGASSPAPSRWPTCSWSDLRPRSRPTPSTTPSCSGSRWS